MSGPLKNEKRELFAHGLAKGERQEDAYRNAGYAGDKAAACRLAGNPEVIARVAEIQAKAARRTELTVATITERLIAIADKAEKLAEAPGLGVARAALMDAAKLNGLVVDTTERITRSPEERAARLAELKAERDAALTRH
jgi:phage terminase small subunit